MSAKDFSLNSPKLLTLWSRFSSLPKGKWLFSKVAGVLSLYTGSIGAQVEEIQEGYAKLTLRDHRKIRNHLNSIHALAQANLGEFATTLAVSSILPEGMRGIPISLSIDYLKKARGVLTAESSSPAPVPGQDQVLDIEAKIVNSEGVLVSKVVVQWKVSPIP